MAMRGRHRLDTIRTIALYTIRTIAAVGALVATAASAGAATGRSDVAAAAMKGDTAAVRSLLQHKADVNAPQVDGATALHWAVYRGDGEAAELLINAGARVDA